MTLAAVPTREVVVIDAGVPDWQTLIADLNPDVSVILLPTGGNGLTALAQALADYGTLGAIHLISHGSDGQLHLGNLHLDAANLGEQADALKQIASHLTSNSDVLLYGCSVAADSTGQAFVNALSTALNGANIAASVDRTGAQALGGNWNLEYSVGHIEAKLPFAMEDIVHYNATFADDSGPQSLTPPAAKLTAATDSGSSSTDGITNKTAVTITGTGSAPSAAVSIYSGGGVTLLGTATADGSGNWSFNYTFAEGSYSIVAKATATGYTISDTPPMALTIDTTVNAPSTPALAAGSDTGSSTTDNITNKSKPTFTGTADKSASVTLYAGATLLGSATANSVTGNWTITSTVTLPQGSDTITAKATDVAGNVSTLSSGLTITVDTAAPSAPPKPALAAGSDTGSSTTDNITKLATPTFTGTAEANATVKLLDTNGTTVLGTATATGGSWSITSSALSEGNHTVTAKATDVAGNTSTASPSLVVTIDTSAPLAPSTPVLNSGSDSGSSSTDNITSVTTPTFTGTAEAGATVTLYDTDGTTVLGTATATGGNWSITSSALSEGNHTVTAKATDTAGNVGSASSGLTVTIDTTAPTAPSTPDLATASDNGVSSTDNITSITTPTFTGTAEAGATVTLYDTDGTTVLGTATATGGSWSITSSALSLGNHTVTAKATDTAGNVGTASSGLQVAVVASNNAPTGAVNIGGTPVVGQVLAASNTLADADGLGVIHYQWKADGTPISGATADTFMLTQTQIGALITVTASYTDGNGTAEAMTSAATGAVASNVVAPDPIPTGILDGATVQTQFTTNAATGLSDEIFNVLTVSATRADNGYSAHPGLADIPIHTDNANLVVSLPTGAGLQSAGSANLLSTSQALSDLAGRIGSLTAAGSSTQSDMDHQSADFIGALPAGTLLATRMLAPSAAHDAVLTQPIILSGSTDTSTSSTQAHATAFGLVIDATGLPSSAALELDNIDFAAVVGKATLYGGDSKTYVVGDDASQTVVLGASNDTAFGGGGNDTLAGGAGNDTLTGGSGDDVLQGGRSDQGQWNFYLSADGKVVAQHVTTQGTTETLQSSTLAASAESGFLTAPAATLESLALLYHAAFSRAPDLAGLNYWAPRGLSAGQLSEQFMQSAEWRDGLGKLDDATFVDQLYLNTLGRHSSAAEQTAALSQINAASNPSQGREQVFEALAFGDAHRAALQGTNGTALGGTLLNQAQGWIAGAGNNVLDGGDGNDTLIGGDGSNTLIGGAGTDTVVYAQSVDHYKFVLGADGQVSITGNTGSIDKISQIELGQFGGNTVDLSFTEASQSVLQQVAMLYHVVLDRTADIPGIAIWTSHYTDLVSLAGSFVNSNEFQAAHGSLDNAAFVNLIMTNALNHAPDAAGVQTWTDYLNTHNRAEMVAALIGNADVVAAQFGAGGLSLA